MVVSQNGFDVGYEQLYVDRLAVQAVVDDFAKRFSLAADCCTAWNQDKRLKGDELLLQV